MAVLEPIGEELAPIVWRALLRPLVSTAGWAVAFGLIYLVDQFCRALFGTVSGSLGWIPWVGSSIQGSIHSVEARLTNALGGALDGIDSRMGASLHGVAMLAHQLAHAQVEVAVNLWHDAKAIANLWGNAATGHIFHKAHDQATTATKVATSAINTATRDNHRAKTYAPAQVVPKVGRLEGEYEWLTDRVIPNLKARTTHVEDSLAKAWQATRSREKLLVGTAFAGAVAVALGRLGLGWLRCSSLRSLGRSIGCGGWRLLEELLAPTLIAFAALDICDFANAAETLALEFVPELTALVDVENALIGCHGATALPTLSIGALHLPPTNLGLPLAA